MKSPFISVVCAVKDRPILLDRCLTSLKSQEYENWELIVVDDGSKGNIESILYDETIYIRIENDQDRPPAISWNTGYKESKGDFIIFMCGDIILSNNNLFSLFLESYNGERQSVLTYFLSQNMTDSLNTIDWAKNPKLIENISGFWDFKLPHHTTTNRMNLAAGLTTYVTGNSRENWDYIGVFRDESHHLVSDQDLHLRERFLGFGVGTIPNIVAYHQWHPNPDIKTGTSYIYKTKKQARLLESAERE